MTQEELAEKCGTNKGYISKIENDIKEVRISTLQKNRGVRTRRSTGTIHQTLTMIWTAQF